MKFASIVFDGKPSWGIVREDGVLDLGATHNHQFPDLKSAIASGRLPEIAAAPGAAPIRPHGSITWLPVIPNPEKIFCVGLNYERHRLETARKEVRHPTIFTRFSNSLIAAEADLVRPSVSEHFDYEGELAVVIGVRGRHVSASEAMSLVAGYTCFNDGSVRDWQNHTHQFTPGKNFPGTGAFGPWMVTPDEMGELGPQRIATRVNGTIVQEALLSEMIFDVAHQIAYCSAFTFLEPGDVIVTGTPGGVGAKRTPPLWLRPGDTVEVEIDKIGVLRNGIRDEAR